MGLLFVAADEDSFTFELGPPVGEVLGVPVVTSPSVERERVAIWTGKPRPKNTIEPKPLRIRHERVWSVEHDSAYIFKSDDDMPERAIGGIRCPYCGETGHHLLVMTTLGGVEVRECRLCTREYRVHPPNFDPTRMRCVNCGDCRWHVVASARHAAGRFYVCQHCGCSRDPAVATEAEFAQEWHEMLAMYAVYSQSRADTAHPMLRDEAELALATRLAWWGIPVTPAHLLTLPMGDVIDALAPRRMLKPPPDPRFGPAVTAETPEEFERIMARHKAAAARKLADEKIAAAYAGRDTVIW